MYTLIILGKPYNFSYDCGLNLKVSNEWHLHESFYCFFFLQGTYPELGITWATFCNNQVECYDGLDERDCKLNIWLIPSLVCGAAIFLCSTLLGYILKKIRKASNEIVQDKQWRSVTNQPIDKRVTKLFKIASLAHEKDSNKIQNIFKIEIDMHQNEGEAICYLKVEQNTCT